METFKTESEPFTAYEEVLIARIVKQSAAVITTAIGMQQYGERASGATFKVYDNLGQVMEDHFMVDIALRELARRRGRAEEFAKLALATQAIDEDRPDLFDTASS